MIDGSEPLGRGDLAIEPRANRSIASQRLPAIRDQVFHRAQMTVVVIAQAARLVIDHPFEFRQAILHRLDQLVDLLLILDQRKTRTSACASTKDNSLATASA